MPEIFGAALMGGGSGPAYAAISVTYPAGATCTCALGSKTFTAPDNSGQALFIVPTAGEWVVSISQSGQQTKSVPVNVTENKAYSITLSFDLLIYQNGTLQYITGFNQSDSGGGSYVSQDQKENTIVFSIMPFSGGVVYGKFVSTPAINLSGYSELAIDLAYEYTPMESGENRVDLLNSAGDSVLATSAVANTERQIVNIDISQISQDLAIRFCVCNNSRSVGNQLTVWSIIARNE